MSSFEENKPNLKRCRDSSDDASSSKKVTQHVDENENLPSFFQTFSKDQIEQCNQFLSSLDPTLTSHIPIDQYELVEVKTESQCQQLLEEIFPKDTHDSVLDIALHCIAFNLHSDDKDQQGLIIEKPYRMMLKELNFARLDNFNVFQINSVEMFKCLQGRLSNWLSNFDLPFEVKNNKATSERKHRFRFITYDIKKALFIFEFGFNLPINALKHRIDWHDLFVAIWLFDPDLDKDKFDINKLFVHVQKLVDKVLDFKFPDFKKFIEKAKIDEISHRKKNLTENDRKNVSKNSLLITAIMFHLNEQFCRKLWTDKMYLAYKLIELPARLCLYSLEIHGVQIDQEQLEMNLIRLTKYKENFENQIEVLKKVNNFDDSCLNDEVPNTQNSIINNPSSMVNFFRVQKSAKMTKNVSQASKTSISQLTKHNCPKDCPTDLPNLEKERKRLGRAIYLVVMAIKKQISPDNQIVYCHCNEWSKTGRISMQKPNLISVYKDFNVFENISKELALKLSNSMQNINLRQSSTPGTFQLRKLISVRKNYVLVSADYSQLELRILAHFTQDPALLKTLNDPFSDVFKSIAASWKNVPIEQVDSEMRQQVKQICYGINYGIGDKELAKRLKVTPENAKEFRNNFLARYPQIQKFKDRVVEGCRVNLYVETISQRRRFIANISSNDQLEKWKGQRQAVNTTIQGSAADIFKLAMISVEQEIRRNGFDASLVMQMHDELMYEVKPNQVNRFARLLKDQMELMSRHLDNVILLSKVRSGPNWGSLQDIDIRDS